MVNKQSGPSATSIMVDENVAHPALLRPCRSRVLPGFPTSTDVSSGCDDNPMGDGSDHYDKTNFWLITACIIMVLGLNGILQSLLLYLLPTEYVLRMYLSINIEAFKEQSASLLWLHCHHEYFYTPKLKSDQCQD